MLTCPEIVVGRNIIRRPELVNCSRCSPSQTRSLSRAGFERSYLYTTIILPCWRLARDTQGQPEQGTVPAVQLDRQCNSWAVGSRGTPERDEIGQTIPVMTSSEIWRNPEQRYLLLIEPYHSLKNLARPKPFCFTKMRNMR